ncbi:MAG: hypothetical protein HY757_05710 [Nitrospirae bacterium]|nr:hypothetical protein [Nitrospirota bacterium]
MHEIWEEGAMKGKEFAVDLRPVKERRIFLNDSELREYLSLAQLSPGVQNPDRFRMLINGNEAFTPAGLLFGLLYAWYVNNRFGGIINYEASLLRWKINELIPKPSMERVRMQKRIDFFRNVVFRQGMPLSS